MPAQTKPAKATAAIAVIGIDIGKNVFHLIGPVRWPRIDGQVYPRIAAEAVALPNFSGSCQSGPAVPRLPPGVSVVSMSLRCMTGSALPYDRKGVNSQRR
jgi:hypothetical protein